MRSSLPWWQTYFSGMTLGVIRSMYSDAQKLLGSPSLYLAARRV